MHVCLRQHKDELSEACRVEETKLAAIEYNDIRLATKLNKLCSEEKAVYCKVCGCARANVCICACVSVCAAKCAARCVHARACLYAARCAAVCVHMRGS